MTNRFNLPKEIVSALTKDRYDPKGEIEKDSVSVTTLINPIQLTTLKNRYPDSLKETDVIDYFWSFMGSIAHFILQEHGSDESLTEERLYTEVAGQRISGCSDHYKNETITDYKTTKVYKIMKADYSDWEKQLNLYAFIFGANGYDVKELKVIAILQDWKEHESYKQGYPQCPIVEIPLRLWSTDEQLSYISERVRLLELASHMPDEFLADTIPCSDRDMWRDIKDYAAMKEGASRASKVFDSLEAAQEYCIDKKDVIAITRYTPRTRCLKWCPVSNLCKQHKDLSEAEGSAPIEAGETLF